MHLGNSSLFDFNFILWQIHFLHKKGASVRLKSQIVSIVVVLGFSSQAFAYIDPGIVSLVMQWVYIGAAGLVTFLFMNPIQYFKARFSKKTDSADSALTSPPAPTDIKNEQH